MQFLRFIAVLIGVAIALLVTISLVSILVHDGQLWAARNDAGGHPSTMLKLDPAGLINNGIIALALQIVVIVSSYLAASFSTKGETRAALLEASW
jgi:hypothetical protein